MIPFLSTSPMEFKYRATDQKSPSSRPLPSMLCSFTHLSDQAQPSPAPAEHQGKMTDETLNPTHNAGSTQLGETKDVVTPYEVLRREMEIKEQNMREEMTMMMARIRMLEEEVRTWQQLVLKRLNVGASLPQAQTFTFDTASLLGSKAELKPDSNKDKWILLPTPDHPHLSGTKRHRVEEWTCSLCKVSATCEQGLNEHLLGKKHRVREASLAGDQDKDEGTLAAHNSTDSKSQNAAEGEDVDRNIDAPPAGMDVKKEQAALAESNKDQAAPADMKKIGSSMYWCHVCGVGTNSEAVMKIHVNGKRHMARLKDAEMNNDNGAHHVASSVASGEAMPVAVSSPPMALSTSVAFKDNS